MKQKFELEYTFSTSLRVLFDRLSTPGGLSEWFADDVDLYGDIITFKWKDYEEKARILYIKDNRLIRFKWLNDTDQKSYIEFKVCQHELTGDISLFITDFAEEDEKAEAIDLWDSQISELKHVMGL